MISYLVSLLLGYFAVSAQVFDYNKAYQDYLFSYSIYQQAHSEYDLARSQYLASGTIASEQKAQGATAKMLIERDSATIAYLTALRMKLRENPGVVNTTRENLFSLIDNEISLYNLHKAKVASAGSLEDLVEDSAEAAAQFQQTELLIYQVLTNISVGHTSSFRVREKDIITTLRTKITEIKTAGDKKVDSVERALTEADDKLSRSVEKEQEALALIAKLKTNNKDKLGVFNDTQRSMSESLSYIKEANSIVKDALRQIKTND